MSVLSMGSILRTAQGGIKPLGMGGVLSSTRGIVRKVE